MNFRDEWERKTKEADEEVRRHLPAEEGACKNLIAAMDYAVNAGGKRLRPLLMQETWRLYGGKGEEIGYFMAGMEMIHPHSLIHDDLPALDNDDLRRGKPTVHKAFGEAAAILAGDALLNYAYETMLRAFSCTTDPDRVVRALTLVAEKTGICGMLGGQSVDVETGGKDLKADTLAYIYKSKTSALIEASLMAGAILAGAPGEDVVTLGQAGCLTGLAFQIQDDILDITGTEDELGKPVHSDEKNRKTNYVTIHGLTDSSLEVEKLSSRAVELIKGLERDSAFLERLLSALVHRKF